MNLEMMMSSECSTTTWIHKESIYGWAASPSLKTWIEQKANIQIYEEEQVNVMFDLLFACFGYLINMVLEEIED